MGRRWGLGEFIRFALQQGCSKRIGIHDGMRRLRHVLDRRRIEPKAIDFAADDEDERADGDADDEEARG